MCRRHACPFDVMVLALGLLLLPGTGGTQEPATSSRLRLRNAGSASVRVEVRTATGDDCAAGRLIATQDVPAGRAWVFQSSQGICLRRGRVGPQGGLEWRAWERKQPRVGREEEVIL